MGEIQKCSFLKEMLHEIAIVRENLTHIFALHYTLKEMLHEIAIVRENLTHIFALHYTLTI